jgi:wyosine [tRNA(Phe)-imidazoG37] synthetase (radical SAM superfamily)
MDRRTNIKGAPLAHRYVYGPVPSKRLGRSLGIDLVPYKTCTYDCIYCQLGRTTDKTIERKAYGAVEDILAELGAKLRAGPQPDYISLAGSGEPTLNLHIGELIESIKGMTDIPVAVLTNGSLLWQEDVRAALMAADLVLPSLDAGDGNMFQYVNHPHGDITFEKMVDGLGEFIRVFPKSVRLEVFLLAGVTGIPREIEKISEITKTIRPERVQLNTVSRPPAEAFADPVSRDQMESFKNLFPGTVEVISGQAQSGPTVSEVGRSRAPEIMSLLKRRPCTLQGIAFGLALSPIETSKLLDRLRRQGALIAVSKPEGVFYKANR